MLTAWQSSGRVSTAVCLFVCFSTQPQLHCKFRVLFQPTQTDPRDALPHDRRVVHQCDKLVTDAGRILSL